ncbi:MAG: galactose-1-phosphate uridylyltransferase [Bryobacteraceae bacterium]|nr:galactose-1-phosphate uridylyltransferase [Bryobacteraceae bacterium]
MSELRWHSLLRQWVVVASHRQNRPQMPANWCPFDPGSGQVPDNYDVYVYPNDFPAFDEDEEPFDPEPGLFRTTGARGKCDVILYHPNHTQRPSDLPAEHWRKIVDVWASRVDELAKLPDVQHIMVFENTGVAIGVTMPHPHGQIYAFPFVPPLVQTELDASREHYQCNFTCLYCELMKREIADKVRIVAENEHFVAFVPFAARFPSEIQLYSRRHFGRLQDMTEEERQSFASMLSTVRRKYDHLYTDIEPKDTVLPLMMVLRMPPVHGNHPFFHFHVEFLPLQRSQKKLKYLAAVETAGGTYLADTRPEERAAALRNAEPATPEA